MKGWIKQVGKLGFAIAKATIPQVNAIESAVDVFKHAANGDEKRAAVKTIVLESLDAAEFVTDKDLLNEPNVASAYDGFISSYVTFQNALADAKAAKVH